MENGLRVIGICGMRIKRGFGTQTLKGVKKPAGGARISDTRTCSIGISGGGGGWGHVGYQNTGSSSSSSSVSGNNWTSTSNITVRWMSTKSRREDNRNIDNFGAWDSTSDLPLQVEASIASGKPIPSIGVKNVGVSSVKGRRNYMEDQYGIEQLGGSWNNSDTLYIAVFDGHGSDACAKFCVNVFPKHLAYWFLKDMDVPSALHKSFVEVNNAFASWYTFNRRGADYISSGSTATICLLRNSVDLYIGHVGDSRAILCRAGEARKITTDHEPSLITEKARIEKSGGRINENNRVNGRLAMSRSIGDLELKKFGVIAVPDIISMKIDHSRDAFLVLTTDGINGVMTDNEIVETVKQTKDPQYAASLLTETAFEYSSEDNNTALVIPLGSWGKYSAAATIFHSFGKSFGSSSRFS